MAQQFDMVIFGGLGDLSLRKLLPALYRSELGGYLPEDARIFLIARSVGERDAELSRVHEWLSNQLKDG